MSVLQALYLILPLLVAGALHAPVIKRDLLRPLARPLDLGLTWRGERLFGANKTWRGPFLMVTVSLAVVYAQSLVYPVEPFHRLSVVDYVETSWVLLGVALGVSYSLSELPNSFAKRRLGIPPGGVSSRRALVQYVVDQGDSALGGTLALALVAGLGWQMLAVVFLVGFGLHVAMDQLFFLFAVKRRPDAAPVPLEGQPT